MSVKDDIRQKLGKSKKPKKPSNSTPRTPRSRTPKVPENIKISWDQISKSIESVWGRKRKDGSRKWESKYAHYLIFKNWVEEMM